MEREKGLVKLDASLCELEEELHHSQLVGRLD
jgi:hypothetical protein